MRGVRIGHGPLSERLACRPYSLLKSKILAPRTCIFLQLVSDHLGVFMPDQLPRGVHLGKTIDYSRWSHSLTSFSRKICAALRATSAA